MNTSKKREQIKNLIYKLLYNHPYSVVRTKVDRLGRQLRELDDKIPIVKSEN